DLKNGVEGRRQMPRPVLDHVEGLGLQEERDVGGQAVHQRNVVAIAGVSAYWDLDTLIRCRAIDGASDGLFNVEVLDRRPADGGVDEGLCAPYVAQVQGRHAAGDPAARVGEHLEQDLRPR